MDVTREARAQDQASLRKAKEPGYSPGACKRATNQQTLIFTVFEAAEGATQNLTHLVPDLDRDRCDYAVASVLLEEAWVSGS